MRLLLPALACGYLLAASSLHAQIVFSETFGSLPSGTDVSTSNTDLTYVRVGEGGGSITFQNSTIGTGSSIRFGGSSSGSLNGFGATSLPSSRITQMDFSIQFEATDGTFFWGMGSGTTFTGSSIFRTADLLWGLQAKDGSLEYRVGSGWQSTEFNLMANTRYDFSILVNGTDQAIPVGDRSLASTSMMLLINGNPIAENLGITGNQSSTAFRFYQVNSGSFAQLDNLVISNSLTAIPEPSTYAAILGALALGLVAYRRRKPPTSPL